MIIALRTQFLVYLPCLNSVLNVKALVGAFSVIVKTDCETDGSFHSTTLVTAAATPHPDVTPPTDHLPPAAGEIIALDT